MLLSLVGLASFSLSALTLSVVAVPGAVASTAPYAILVGGCFQTATPPGNPFPAPAPTNYVDVYVFNIPALAQNSHVYFIVGEEGPNFAGGTTPATINMDGSSGSSGAVGLDFGTDTHIEVEVSYTTTSGVEEAFTTIGTMPLNSQCGTSGFTAVSTGSVTAPIVAAVPSIDAQGYTMVGSDGLVYSYGDASIFGTLGPTTQLNQPIVGMAQDPEGEGYWLAAKDGGIFAYGNAQFFGSTGGMTLNEPIVGIAATPDGGGYYEVASDGGIFAFGDAKFYGSMGGSHLNQPIVGMAVDPATGGYWLVAADGGIFAFNAPFSGSTGSIPLNKPIVGMEAAPDGSGYRFVASDGGIFCFNEPFSGSMGGQPLNEPIVAMAPAGSSGYWLVAADGGIFSFGGAPFEDSPA
jgi:hypothetical protein